MRRSIRLVAAAWWLLQLGACGDQPPPRAPHQAGAARAHPPVARASRRDSEPGAGGRETRENTGEIAGRGRETGPREGSPTSDQLAQHYRGARPLAVLQGSGSYYSDAFAGRSTASGAPYMPSAFTAAHRSLPFGTVLRVTRVDGGQSVYVRVTDRGPYGPRGRILDLSRAAAERLGMLRAGVAKIRVEVLEYGPKKTRRRKH